MEPTSDLCERYARDISGIAVAVGDLTIVDLLVQNDRFVELYNDAPTYLQCARHLMTGSDAPDIERQIAALTMHGAGLDGYVAFAEDTVAAHDAEKVSREVLETVILPPADWAHTLVFNYSDPRVIALYRAYTALEDANPVKVKAIEGSILTGETAAFLKDTYGR